MDSLPPLQDWLDRNTPEIEEAIEFTKTAINAPREKLNELGAEASAKSANMGYLLADAKQYLLVARSQVLNRMPDDLGPTAQKIFLESETATLARLVDRLKVCVSSLKTIGINVCSIRKVTPF